jgi:hypothetical protein
MRRAPVEEGAPAKRGGTRLTEEAKVMRKLAFENLDDEVREVLRDEIRDNISTHVRDTVLGAAEAMTALLPMAIASLHNDLAHGDIVMKQRAAALVLKYAMPLGDEKGEKDDMRILHLHANVALPDTPLGHKTLEYIDADDQAALEAGRMEPWELGYPECEGCKERKPPENGRIQADGTFRCRACDMRATLKRNPSPDATMTDSLMN